MPTSSDLPDLRAHGYEAAEPLGSNSEGGRLTFRGRALAGGRTVVIKQFRFATRGASWKEYDAHQREIQALRELRHPRIPAFVDAFQTDDGFCLVQAHVPHPSLASRGSFELEELRAVASSVLEILEYLQSRVPPVFHRDVKPANVLVDGEGHAYLVDFGLARTGAGARSGSTVAVGTPGFMPPEQLFGRELTASSDLYGLGATLIGILSGRRAGEVGDLVDNRFAFRLDELPRSLPRAWRAWLGKLVAPEVEDRFADARTARAALPAAGADAEEEARAEARAREKEKARAEASARASAEARARDKARAEARARTSSRAGPGTSGTPGAIRAGLLVAVLVGAGGIYGAISWLGASGDESSTGEAVEESSGKRAEEKKPETEEEKRARWGSSACTGVVECYTAAGYNGAMTVRAEADLSPEGKAVDARFSGDGGRTIEACVLEVMRSKVVDDYDGGEGVMWCQISGNVMGGALMIGSSEGWTPGRPRGDEAGGTTRRDGAGDGAGDEGAPRRRPGGDDESGDGEGGRARRAGADEPAEDGAGAAGGAKSGTRAKLGTGAKAGAGTARAAGKGR